MKATRRSIFGMIAAAMVAPRAKATEPEPRKTAGFLAPFDTVGLAYTTSAEAFTSSAWRVVEFDDVEDGGFVVPGGHWLNVRRKQ